MYMRHPHSGPITTVTPEAFEQIWKAKGWQEVPDEDGLAAEVAAVEAQTPGVENLEQPLDVVAATQGYESLKKEELVTLADDRGVDSSGTKADIITRLQDADAGTSTDGSSTG